MQNDFNEDFIFTLSPIYDGVAGLELLTLFVHLSFKFEDGVILLPLDVVGNASYDNFSIYIF